MWIGVGIWSVRGCCPWCFRMLTQTVSKDPNHDPNPNPGIHLDQRDAAPPDKIGGLVCTLVRILGVEKGLASGDMWGGGYRTYL